MYAVLFEGKQELLMKLRDHTKQLRKCVIYALPAPDLPAALEQFIFDKARHNHSLIRSDFVALLKTAADDMGASEQKQELLKTYLDAFEAEKDMPDRSRHDYSSGCRSSTVIFLCHDA